MFRNFLAKVNAKYFAIIYFITNLVTALIVLPKGMIEKVLTSDAKGYYQFLPQIFIYGDLKKLPWAIVLENGNHLSLFHIGIAILELPFFLIGHATALIFDLDPSGYSDVYSWSITTATIFYSSLGIYMIYRILEKRFSKNVVLLTLILLFLGTNLYYYCTIETASSHPFSFFLFAGILFFTEKYYEKPNWKYAAIIGAISGIILVIKPNNLIITLYFIFYGIKTLNDFKTRILFFLKQYKHVLLILGIIVLTAIPQLLYWNLVSGKLLLFSYGEGGQKFFWTNPQFWNVVFHPQNGLFLYEPILLFSAAGLIYGIIKKQMNFVLIFVIMILTWYVFASWWCWWFGGAFGHRAFLEYLPLLAFPLAYFISLSQKWNKGLKITFGTICLLFVFVTVRMTFIYHWPWDGPDWGWDDYWMVIKTVFFSR